MTSTMKLGFRKIKVLSTIHLNDLEANCKILLLLIFLCHRVLNTYC